MIKRVLKSMALASALFCAVSQAASTLALDPPGGAISGAPGATVGWGFTLTNTTDYLVISSASFVPTTPLGTFTDFISAFNFFVVGPAPDNTSVSQTFDVLNQTGVGSFAIDAGALIGAVASGQIVLNYDLFSVSPNHPLFNPDTDTLSNGNTLAVNASVTVVPEPEGLLLMAVGLIVLYGAHRHRG
ncbi:MAG: hypothetical protein M3A44_14460 [Gammaproteobacteria bacterium]